MGARTGEQFLEGLRRTKRQLWLDGERVDDVTAHPALAGAAPDAWPASSTGSTSSPTTA